MISACIPHRIGTRAAEADLYGCIGSLLGHDELIVVANQLGIPAAFNACLRSASGDYIILIASDSKLTRGALWDLPDERGVTIPLVNGTAAWNPVYCFPRWVYEDVGSFDERFSPAYYEDDDMLHRLALACISVIVKRSVNFTHPNPGSTITQLYADSPSTVHLSETYQRSRARFIQKWGREPYEHAFVEDENPEN